jgi:hypothetical protein
MQAKTKRRRCTPGIGRGGMRDDGVGALETVEWVSIVMQKVHCASPVYGTGGFSKDPLNKIGRRTRVNLKPGGRSTESRRQTNEDRAERRRRRRSFPHPIVTIGFPPPSSSTRSWRHARLAWAAVALRRPRSRAWEWTWRRTSSPNFWWRSRRRRRVILHLPSLPALTTRRREGSQSTRSDRYANQTTRVAVGASSRAYAYNCVSTTFSSH